MAVAGIQLSAEVADLKELQQSIGRLFTPADKASILEAAIEKAIYPAFLRLREVTPAGPTGNLRRAISYKVVKYPLDGTAVGILGFRRAGRGPSESAQGGTVRQGPDRAFHQWWLEYGTQQRQVSKIADKPYTRLGHTRRMRSGKVVEVATHEVKRQGGYIASSYNRLGEFRVLKTARPARGQQGHRVQTDPQYPNAFFKKSSTPIVIPPMPIGGSRGEPPLQTAWNNTRATVAEYLRRELRISLEAALSSLSQSAIGSVDS